MMMGTACPVAAQQYTGLSGLLHTPSAEMYAEGTVQVGGSYLNKAFSPQLFSYPTANYYLTATPLRWVELAYTCTLLRDKRYDKYAHVIDDGSYRYYHQDRYFSIKVQPLREGRFWPSVVLGANDPVSTRGSANSANVTSADYKPNSQYFGNLFVAASKHLDTRFGEWGIHVAYRHFKRDYNAKWNGVTGGVTYRPCFARDVRAVVEYTGNEVNVGADWLLWKHFFVQGILQDGRYLSASACFRMNLF
jgi:hypothetical protein